MGKQTEFESFFISPLRAGFVCVAMDYLSFGPSRLLPEFSRVNFRLSEMLLFVKYNNEKRQI